MRFSISRFALVLITSGVVFATLSPVSAQAQATFEILPFTDGDGRDHTSLLDLSGDGQTVIGWQREIYNSRFFRDVPVRWDVGVGSTPLSPGVDLEARPFYSETPFGISDDGSTIVGQFRNGDPATGTQATALPDGQPWLPILTDPGSALIDASADGSVLVGGRSPQNLRPGNGGFVWDTTNGVRDLQDLTGVTDSIGARAISDDGTLVVGSVFPDSTSINGSRGYSWSEEGGYVELPALSDGLDSFVLDVSGDGSTIVGFSGAGGVLGLRATKWTDEGATMLPGAREEVTTRFGTLYADVSPYSADAASYDGSVIAGQADLGGLAGAYIYFGETDETRLLRELLIDNGATEAADWDLITATNLSADGRVVTGWARPQSHLQLPIEMRNQTGRYFAFRAVIPEPSMALLVGLGLLGLAGRRAS